MHDGDENWLRLSGWDEAELYVPGCSAEWDVQCATDTEMAAAINIEIWVDVRNTTASIRRPLLRPCLDVVWYSEHARVTKEQPYTYKRNLRRRHSWSCQQNLNWSSTP